MWGHRFLRVPDQRLHEPVISVLRTIEANWVGWLINLTTTTGGKSRSNRDRRRSAADYRDTPSRVCIREAGREIFRPRTLLRVTGILSLSQSRIRRWKCRSRAHGIVAISSSASIHAPILACGTHTLPHPFSLALSFPFLSPSFLPSFLSVHSGIIVGEK